MSWGIGTKKGTGYGRGCQGGRWEEEYKMMGVGSSIDYAFKKELLGPIPTLSLLTISNNNDSDQDALLHNSYTLHYLNYFASPLISYTILIHL